jgi:hypothetical protein
VRLPFDTTSTNLAWKPLLAAVRGPDRKLMPTKLIEVALPLDVINKEAAREKSIRHGHPSTLHLWWARRPLAACRAVLFAQLVDDPSAHPDRFPTPEDQDRERQRLLRIIERLVPSEASTDEKILEEARAEIRKCYPDGPPPIVDPFCGGGSIPLEAQRLGLEARASDLNPVAVLITKALIEPPPRFAGRPPVCPVADGTFGMVTTEWAGATGLAEDIRFYGSWMRDRAAERIGHLYPKTTLPDESPATVIAWLWARTVICPNLACGSMMPLVRSFWLGKKKGKEAWVRAVPEPADKRVRFEIGHGKEGPPVEGTVGRTGATCLICQNPVPLEHVRSESRAGRLGAQLMAIVAEGARQRVYLPPDAAHQAAANVSRPDDVPDTELPEKALSFRVQAYGMTHHADLFTNRQLAALCVFQLCQPAVRRPLEAPLRRPVALGRRSHRFHLVWGQHDDTRPAVLGVAEHHRLVQRPFVRALAFAFPHRRRWVTTVPRTVSGIARLALAGTGHSRACAASRSACKIHDSSASGPHGGHKCRSEVPLQRDVEWSWQRPDPSLWRPLEPLSHRSSPRGPVAASGVSTPYRCPTATHDYGSASDVNYANYGLSTKFTVIPASERSAIDWYKNGHLTQEMWEGTGSVNNSTWVEAGLYSGPSIIGSEINTKSSHNFESTYFWADNRKYGGTAFHIHAFTPAVQVGKTAKFAITKNSGSPGGYTSWHVEMAASWSKTSPTTYSGTSTHDPGGLSHDASVGVESTCGNPKSNEWAANRQTWGVKVYNSGTHTYSWHAGWAGGTSAVGAYGPEPTYMEYAPSSGTSGYLTPGEDSR